jgi:hypothetical protein
MLDELAEALLLQPENMFSVAQKGWMQTYELAHEP